MEHVGIAIVTIPSSRTSDYVTETLKGVGDIQASHIQNLPKTQTSWVVTKLYRW